MKYYPPGSVIGILGGGQLGRMLSLAGARLGFDMHIFSPERNSPAGRVAAKTITADFNDREALQHFAEECDILTYELEHLPLQPLCELENLSCLRPGLKALRVAQDRLKEKTLFRELGLSTVDFHPITEREDLDKALQKIPLPAILKTRFAGYDGKGQKDIHKRDDLATAWEDLGKVPALLEAFSSFKREVSIIAARNAEGSFSPYPLSENLHKNHILSITHAPAFIKSDGLKKASESAQLVGDSLEYKGVFALEFFEMENGELWVNEMAPRVHNSGHWTEAVCSCDQFEQHIRAIAGWPLGDVRAFAAAEMINLLGDDVQDWLKFSQEKTTRLHLYGKKEQRPGRKMGHIIRSKPLPL